MSRDILLFKYHEAKQKPLESLSAEELGIDLNPKISTVKVSPPPEKRLV